MGGKAEVAEIVLGGCSARGGNIFGGGGACECGGGGAVGENTG